MKEWNKEDFYDFILENKVIGFFEDPITLKSGRKSYWYVNWRNVAEDVYLIDKLADFLINYVNMNNWDPDCFYGVPEGATKLALLSQYKWAKDQSDYQKGNYVFSMGRGKAKSHGAAKDRYFLGIPTGKVIILEDVSTTGNSMIETIKTLKKLEIDIIAAICLTNRNELRKDNKSVEEKIGEFGIKYYSMSDALDLLPRLNPPQEIQKQIISYFDQYGVQSIIFKN